MMRQARIHGLGIGAAPLCMLMPTPKPERGPRLKVFSDDKIDNTREFLCAIPGCGGHPQIDVMGTQYRMECDTCFVHTDWQPTKTAAQAEWRSPRWRRSVRDAARA